MDDLLSEFLTEANESLSGVDNALLTLERTPGDKATIGLIFRLVHTIKGTCGFLGLPRLERVAHSSENVFGSLREGTIAASPDVISAVFRALDAMKEIVATLGATGREPEGDDSAVISVLDSIFNAEPLLCSANLPTLPSKKPKRVGARLGGRRRPAKQVAETEIVPDAACEMANPIVLRDVDGARNASAAPPVFELGQSRPADESASREGGIGQQTIRVSVAVLENLMTLVSELVLTRNQLLQISRNTKEPTYSVPVQRLSQITSDLQEGVMKTRMQPIGSAWSKLPRLIRDLSRDLGKPMELKMVGAETEMDRQVLELIRDPLTHMIRNSADHGLETAGERLAAGKPATGTITLRAYHESGHITVEIADDGRGLPLERIRQKILSNGLATEGELAAMSEAAVQRYIFHAGFSTAAQVTSVSGRGVGMDVVKTNIEQIGGSIELRSQAGIGTTFVVNIPLTLAIVSALIVESAGERFAIAQSSVAELVYVEQARQGDAVVEPGQIRLETIDGTPVLRLRDRLLPLISLGDLLKLSKSAEANPKRGSYVVVVSLGSSTFGIMVDRVFDTEEIVVKPVAPVLRHIDVFSGNTVLGDGAVIMILDPNGIARAANVVAAPTTQTLSSVKTSGTSSEDSTSILLFKAGSAAPKAVPLSLVARLEKLAADRFESVGGRFVTRYFGKLMPLVAFKDDFSPANQLQHPVMVFTEGERSVGLIVDEIVDVVHESMVVEKGGSQPGLLGIAILNGAATEVVDTAHWLSLAGDNWFQARPAGDKGARRLLVVEDSAFFRNMMIPALSSAGYHVTAVNGGAEALALRDAGESFEAIISDIEMPGMNGLAFVRAVREEGTWSELPVIALSGLVGEANVKAGIAAGFTRYMAKFDRAALIDCLRHCLQPELKRAA